ncbi:MAG TPA: hypothetical protein EYQ64_14625 [Gemmatimonadetes bacterium]|jgi:hypothetical protein|nr:hypothetical protein [Gemmatimonadota bacterium]
MNLPEKTNHPDKVYTEKELSRAKTTSRVIGWLQGGGIVLGGAILWNLMGWIPVVVGLAAVGWVAVKLMGRSKKQEEDE